MPEYADVRISIEPGTVEDVRKTVLTGLFDYNDRFAGPMGNASLTIGARDGNQNIIGGLLVGLQPGWRWMRLDWLWIEESHRGAGIGRRLIELAEREGQKLGCLHVAVDTLEFQARGFYEKLGYSVYAVQEDYPVGHRKFLMRKTLY
jgi:ribosomal protein S18 acetylase RimI-like enzyme